MGKTSIPDRDAGAESQEAGGAKREKSTNGKKKRREGSVRGGKG